MHLRTVVWVVRTVGRCGQGLRGGREGQTDVSAAFDSVFP